MMKRVSVSLPDEVYDAVVVAAKAERRSVSQLIAVVLEAWAALPITPAQNPQSGFDRYADVVEGKVELDE